MEVGTNTQPPNGLVCSRALTPTSNFFAHSQKQQQQQPTTSPPFSKLQTSLKLARFGPAMRRASNLRNCSNSCSNFKPQSSRKPTGNAWSREPHANKQMKMCIRIIKFVWGHCRRRRHIVVNSQVDWRRDAPSCTRLAHAPLVWPHSQWSWWCWRRRKSYAIGGRHYRRAVSPTGWLTD